jgi:hypothetical protein
MTYSVHKKSKRSLAGEDGASVETGLTSFLNSNAVNGDVVAVIYQPEDVIVVTRYSSPAAKK